MESVKYSDRKTSFTHRIGEGEFGSVYRYDDIVIKKYFRNYATGGHIKEDIFYTLKDINSKTFMDLIDCSITTVESKGLDYGKKVIRAYSSKYVKKSNKKSIDMPMDYTINSIYEMFKLIKIFNELGIRIEDTFGDNLIVTDENIVIIDPDFYSFDKRLDIMKNLEGLNRYISELWCNEYGISQEDEVARFNMNKFFYKESYENYMKEMCKILNEKTPRDIIKKTLHKK